MSSPWQILGLPPGSSLAEVKAAYAKLLRQHRPDVDPEGFRALRDAYEWVRTHLDVGAARPVRTASPPTQPDPPARSGPAPPGPAARRQGRTRNRRPSFAQRWRPAINRARTRGAERSEHRLLSLLVARWCDAECRTADVSELLGAELERVPATVRKLVPVEAAVTAIEHGELTVPLRLLRAILVAGVHHDVEPLVSAIELAAASDDAGSDSTPIEDLALEIAVLDVYVAERIANALFRARAVSHMELERRLIAGRELRTCRLQDRLMITRVLFDAEVDEDHELVAQATALFRRLHKSKPVALQLFRQRFPRIELPPTGPGRAVATKSGGRRRQTSSNAGVHLVVIFLCVSLLRALVYWLSGSRG